MYIIEQVTNDALQTRNLFLQDGSSLSLTICFKPMQFGWFITELVYGTLIIRGVRITNSPNMLYQFMNQIPFGLACYTEQNREPSQQDDFSSTASKLYLLDQAECLFYKEFLENG